MAFQMHFYPVISSFSLAFKFSLFFNYFILFLFFILSFYLFIHLFLIQTIKSKREIEIIKKERVSEREKNIKYLCIDT
jgi:hypothetical protein